MIHDMFLYRFIDVLVVSRLQQNKTINQISYVLLILDCHAMSSILLISNSVSLSVSVIYIYTAFFDLIYLI